MATNEFLPFADSATGDDILSQAAYSVDPQRPIGKQLGLARRALDNKALRQSTALTAALAQLTVDRAGVDMLDDGNQIAQKAALAAGIDWNLEPANHAEAAANTLDGTETWTFKKAGLWARAKLSNIADFVVKTATSFVQAGAGSVPRTTQDKMRERISPEDFGATGTGDDSAPIIAAAAAAASKAVTFVKTLSATGLSAVQARFSTPSIDFSNKNESEIGLISAQFPAAQTMTWSSGGRFVRSTRNGAISGNDVYNAIFPNVAHFSTFEGVTDIADGSTIEHAAGVSGYVRCNDTSPANAVALFGCGLATKNGSGVWGINTLLQDNSTRAVGALTSVQLINELDFNVMCPGTNVIGLSLGGNSLSQPSSAVGFMANSLGSGIQWDVGYQTVDGTVKDADNKAAFLAGNTVATATANAPSQRIAFYWRDGSGVRQPLSMQATQGWLIPFGPGFVGINVLGADYYCSTGRGLIVNGNRVVTDRQTGWTAGTGTPNKGAFAADTATAVQAAQRILAIEQALRAHGLIN